LLDFYRDGGVTLIEFAKRHRTNGDYAIVFGHIYADGIFTKAELTNRRHATSRRDRQIDI